METVPEKRGEIIRKRKRMSQPVNLVIPIGTEKYENQDIELLESDRPSSTGIPDQKNGISRAGRNIPGTPNLNMTRLAVMIKKNPPGTIIHK